MLGTLSEFTLAQLLQLFALSERSGTISIHAGAYHTRLLIESDRVVGLGAADLDVRLELRALERTSRMTRHALDELVPRRDTPGLWLVAGNSLDPFRRELYMSRRLEQDVYPLLNLDDGAFEISVERCPPTPVRVSATVQQLILDSSRWEAESDALRSEGYQLDVPWRRSSDGMPETQIHFDRSAWLVWAGLGSQRSIAELAACLAIPDLAAASAVKHLHAHDLVERVR